MKWIIYYDCVKASLMRKNKSSLPRGKIFHFPEYGKWIVSFMFGASLLVSPIYSSDSYVNSNAATSDIRRDKEYAIKAAYLYNFLLFMELADERVIADETITIGILSRKNLFGTSFKRVEGKLIKLKDRRLEIRDYGPYRQGLDLSQCRLLFISSSEMIDIKNILEDIKGKPVLTVGDTRGFLEAGGMVNLVRVNDKIRWEINQTPIKDAGLRLSSQLFRMAVRTIQHTPLTSEGK